MKQQKEITRLLKQLAEIGPFHPGKISQQYVRCSKKGCACGNKKNPKKHGPYNQLSYAVGKKNSSVFLKAEDLPQAQKWLEAYQEFKEVVEQLTNAYVSLAKESRWKLQ